MLFGALLVGESGKWLRKSGTQSPGASVQRSRLIADNVRLPEATVVTFFDSCLMAAKNQGPPFQ
jgi:hypothetical protein